MVLRNFEENLKVHGDRNRHIFLKKKTPTHLEPLRRSFCLRVGIARQKFAMQLCRIALLDATVPSDATDRGDLSCTPTQIEIGHSLTALTYSSPFIHSSSREDTPKRPVRCRPGCQCHRMRISAPATPTKS
jgi:hypothetical protein